ncbi:MAG: twitching motility protein PilT [Chloroflexales bacterium]|nr:twitching motility protein PilT [Chloroflexales bacterium]
MKISLNFIARIAGMLVMAAIGAAVGRALSNPVPDETQQLATQLLMLAGAGLGLLTTPRLTIDPLQNLLRRVSAVPLADVLMSVAGAILGLIVAVLLAIPLGYLPAPFSQFGPLLAALLLGYTGGMIFTTRRREIGEWFVALRRTPALTPAAAPTSDEPPAPLPQRYLLDTSAIVDGRIAGVCKTGFLEGVLIVPTFVLNELQGLADSGDELRRSKGRRGLDLLNQMQRDATVPVEVLDVDVSGPNRVDDKLVVLARQYLCPIITNDFNLKGVAALQGVHVLNLNELSDAVRPSVLHGQLMYVTIHKEGRERQQGLAYLEDGTPVVVEGARRLIGQSVETVVTRVHQTTTGRIVFAELNHGNGRSESVKGGSSASAAPTGIQRLGDS